MQTLWLGGLVAWFVKEKTSGFEQAPTPHDLNFLFRYLTEVVPDGCGTPRDLIQLLDSRGAARNQAIGRGPDAISGDDWVAFLRRLAASKHRMASLWGRYGLLHRQCEDRRQRAKAPDLSQSLLAEVEAWLKDYGDVTGAVPDRNPKLQDDLCRAVNTMHNQLVYELKPPAPVAVRRPPPTPPAQQAAPPAASQSPPAVARLRFEEIELQGFTADGFDGLLACGENCDVLWQEKAVAIIGKQGAAREIRPLETLFFKVYWDGRNIWIATRHEGIWVLSTEGRILTKIGAGQGLPPADRGLLLHFLAPGKACAAGSFGEHSRAWVAIIEFGAGGAKVNVFHQATHLPPAAAFGPKNLTDPELVFTPRFFCDYDAGNGSPRLLLLGRGGSFPLPLLAIDPGTLQVSEFTDPSGKQFGALSDSYTNRKGEILRIEGGIVKQLARPGSTLADGNTARPLVLASADEAPRAPVERPRSPAVRGVRPEPILDANAIRGSRLLEYRGAIYVPGLVGQSGYEAVGGGRYLPRSDRSRARWFRIDPETFRAEVLDLGPSYPGQPCWYSVSSHYGLVGGCRAIGRSPARFFRVSVAEAGKDGAAPAPEGVGPGFRAVAFGTGDRCVVGVRPCVGRRTGSGSEGNARRGLRPAASSICRHGWSRPARRLLSWRRRAAPRDRAAGETQPGRPRLPGRPFRGHSRRRQPPCLHRRRIPQAPAGVRHAHLSPGLSEGGQTGSRLGRGGPCPFGCGCPLRGLSRPAARLGLRQPVG